MPSGPVAFETSKDVKRSNTSGSVQSRSGSICILRDLSTEIILACESEEEQAVEILTEGITEHCGFSFVSSRCSIA